MCKLYNIKKEVIIKIITSLFLEVLILIIPIYWSKSINYISSGRIDDSYYLIIITLLLSLFYYLWNFFNQKAWYLFYNKIYLFFSKSFCESKKKLNINLGKYSNIVNNDVDIVCTFFCNLITRIIQVLEFLVIYIYFLSINFYIFILSVIVSIFMIFLIVRFNNTILKLNLKRKENLDNKSLSTYKMFNILKKNGIYNHNEFLESTFNYLHSNSNYNIFVNSTIYFILAFIEFIRYLVIVYSIYLVSVNKLELGSILLIYTYYGRMITNFEVFTTIIVEYQSVKVSFHRIKSLD